MSQSDIMLQTQNNIFSSFLTERYATFIYFFTRFKEFCNEFFRTYEEMLPLFLRSKNMEEKLSTISILDDYH